MRITQALSKESHLSECSLLPLEKAKSGVYQYSFLQKHSTGLNIFWDLLYLFIVILITYY